MFHRCMRLAALVAIAGIFIACSDKDEASRQKSTDNHGGDISAGDTSGTNSSTEGNGVEIVSADGKFRIRMPEGFSNPTEGTLPLVAGTDTTMMRSYTAVRDTSTAFIIAFTEVGERKVVDHGQVFDMARDASLRNINGTLERQESRTLDGHPGRSIFFTGQLEGKPLSGRADLYLALPRLYQIYYISTDQGSVKSEGVERAFSSFSLIEN